ncbi:unnamed protein product [Effrenium voratum]|uniref:Calmodulin n=1 Tax=Effrenium voratum TaxID=2562239 RepID=A0AA36J0M9_9DINO|nr:unnamed protein product [Effrenium voratum]CAJ1397061.1 unnamed protein product [Effrenium voratum]CAJ1457258.1 unnamed protein product [Effrenium voratum]
MAFNAEQRAEFQEAFDLFADAGRLPSRQLVSLLRSLGQNPTQEEAAKVKADAGVGDSIQFDDFLSIMEVMVEDSDRREDEELREAFDAIANEGLVRMSDIRKTLDGLAANLPVSDHDIYERHERPTEEEDKELDFDAFKKMLAG